jgi:hypothetical protein
MALEEVIAVNKMKVELPDDRAKYALLISILNRFYYKVDSVGKDFTYDFQLFDGNGKLMYSTSKGLLTTVPQCILPDLVLLQEFIQPSSYENVPIGRIYINELLHFIDMQLAKKRLFPTLLSHSGDDDALKVVADLKLCVSSGSAYLLSETRREVKSIVMPSIKYNAQNVCNNVIGVKISVCNSMEAVGR